MGWLVRRRSELTPSQKHQQERWPDREAERVLFLSQSSQIRQGFSKIPLEGRILFLVEQQNFISGG